MDYNDLTVILTLKDRASFTYRWMRWMEVQRFPYKILIADGGSNKEIERNLSDRSNYPNLDYDYIRYPYDSDVETFVRKLADVAGRVRTEYVISADNDDLILLEPLEANLSLIRKRGDVHTLGPAHYRFKIHKKVQSVDELVFADNGRSTFVRLAFAKDEALEDVDPISRLLAVAERFYAAAIWYGIHPTVTYKRICRGLQEMRAQRLLFIEWYTIYSFAIAGKIILGRTEPFLLRQDDTGMRSGATLPGENHSSTFLFRDWSSQLFAMIDDLYDWSAELGCELDRATFEENFRVEFRKHMLRKLEFRGLADKFTRFPKMYSLGRELFALYRGIKNRELSRREIGNIQSLSRARDFISTSDGGRN